LEKRRRAAKNSKYTMTTTPLKGKETGTEPLSGVGKERVGERLFDPYLWEEKEGHPNAAQEGERGGKFKREMGGKTHHDIKGSQVAGGGGVRVGGGPDG